MRTLFNTLALSFLFSLSFFSSFVSAAQSCEIGMTKYLYWQISKVGRHPDICISSCRYKFPSSYCGEDDCQGSAISDGNSCTTENDSGLSCSDGDTSCPEDGGIDDGEGDDDGDWEPPPPPPPDAGLEVGTEMERCRWNGNHYFWKCTGFKSLYDSLNYVNNNLVHEIRARTSQKPADIVPMIKQDTQAIVDGAKGEILTKMDDIQLDLDFSPLYPNLAKIDLIYDDLSSFILQTGSTLASISRDTSKTVQGMTSLDQQFQNERAASGSRFNTLMMFLSRQNDDAETYRYVSQQSFSNLSNSMQSGFDALDNKLDGLELGGDMSGVENGLSELGDKLDGIADQLGGKGLTKGEHGSLVDFEGTGLYSDTAIEAMNNEVESLKQEYRDKMSQFKELFSFDASQLNSGQYQDHNLNLKVAGKNLNLKSGVMPALIDMSPFINAVMLFVAIIIGVRIILGARN